MKRFLHGVIVAVGMLSLVDSFAQASPIECKWDSLGREKGFLGQPTTGELVVPDRTGRYMHFAGGSIYWSRKSDAHEVHGDIRGKWADLGWERSFLGFPVTDETGTPDGVGRFNHFQGGSIYWSRKPEPTRCMATFAPNGPAWVGSGVAWAIRSAMKWTGADTAGE